MSVKLIDNAAFYGYRTRRTVAGKLYQEYFPLKPNGKKLSKVAVAAVKKQAEARDDELIALKEKDRKKHKAERCFKPDGSVSGIAYMVKQEKSGTKTPIFQMGIASQLDHKIVCTSVSLNAHGKEAAWGKIIAQYAAHKQINKGTKLYRELMGAMDATCRQTKAKKGRA